MAMDLHVVSFNVPWPADYGGVIDVYYRCKALAKMGVRVHLHCYCYGRKPAKELEDCCAEVCYYERDCSPKNLLTRRPYIVSSRRSAQLLERLLRDDFPVLLEGLHCCWLLEKLREISPSRNIFVRAHNVEHDYYARLSKVEQRLLKRPYLAMEARKLKRYEHVLCGATGVLAVTEADASHFRDINCEQVVLMPSSHCYEEVASITGRGAYAFYHGNLSVPENEEAAKYLMEKVFVDDSHNLILAGLNPTQELLKMAKSRPWVKVIPNPSDDEMSELLRNAHLSILVTSQATGLKLKLLNSLYSGRFCVVNSAMVWGTRLGDLCCVADTPDEMRKVVGELFEKEFSERELEERRKGLGNCYDNAHNARLLITLLEKY